MEKLFGLKEKFQQSLILTASRINSRNASVFLESGRSIDMLHTFLLKKRDEDGETHPELISWLDRFEINKEEAALDFWYDIHKGIHETLREF
jgi:glyceraldehyde-3-phosphate dehydrogenase (ferredoxin)